MINDNYQHPSKDILESKGTILRGKTICMCLTGSVAVITSPIVARELMRLGAEVICVMSKAATELINPSLMEWATGNKVITNLTGAVEHVYLAGDRPKTIGKADIILVCPATANTISKIASGIDDTPVTTVVSTAFGTSIPIVIVPAMHESMYRHPILKQNENKLRECGVEILRPRLSEGKAKIARIDDIIDRVIDILVTKKDFEGKRVLITAGPTREAIDSVRFVSNKSSGKMGIEIAKEAAARGAEVILIAGECRAKLPEYIETIHVVSTDDFIKAVKNEISYKTYDFFISAAAISDYKPIECIEGKISSDNVEELHLNMRLTPKIIDVARKKDYNLFIVAFKAETDVSRSELINRAYNRLKKSEIDLIVANDIGREDIGFSSKYNEVYIIDKKKHITHVERNTKRYIASKVLDVVLEARKTKQIKSD
ncbi:MAG: bifunctional phosphopantothenoylcysteine decarboxylase/phosphopantothenate--cysteine ligase CoaBC [Candidatus Lokiarchaeota archaeon]|nr:bifunctional phosphopantothenoylcysteine decarboxylase/phosphopantothenate--cysteine ligase CoaBC [Candidatus Lokiarchaeota archaeon]